MNDIKNVDISEMERKTREAIQSENLSDDEKMDLASALILAKYKAAYVELAK